MQAKHSHFRIGLRPVNPAGTETGRYCRRAAVIVQVAVMSTVIMGFGALAVDIGLLYTTKAEMQAAADAAALAGASQLAGDGVVDPEALARASAVQYAGEHLILGEAVQLDPYTDVEVGKAFYNPSTQKFEFQPSCYNFDAVRVTVRKTSESSNGAVPLMFGRLFGEDEGNLEAQAAAVLIPRDIAVVIDLSNSMCWDSELRYWNRSDGGYSNLRDVWCALDGPEPSRPYIPGSPTETEYAGDTGPTYGQMTEWGDYLFPGAYEPSPDPGLLYLPRGESWGPYESGEPFLHDENVLDTWPESQDDNCLMEQGYDVWERWAVLTNETCGYLSAAATDGLGFTSRVIWRESVGDGHDKITVYVTADGSGGTPALSNFQIELSSSALATALATARSQGNHFVEIINPDPHTGLTGIKFEGTDLGEYGADTEWFTCEVPSGSTDSGVVVACKAGPNHSSVGHQFESVDTWNSTRWRLRVGTVLGLVETWHSGVVAQPPPAVPHPGGDGDGKIEDEGEVDWLGLPSYARNWNWKHYMDRVKYAHPSAFRNRFGLKTYTDFLLEKRPESYATDILWATPEQPLRATKDAVQTMVDVITALDSLDHISLEIFATVARHQVNLSDDLQAVPDVLYDRQSGHWDRCTNIGGGLQEAIDELKSSRARGASAKVIVLMSDGVANIDENGGGNTQAARDYALAKAEEAADEGYRIYCVSVGYSVDRELMQAMATIGHGQEFYAVGSPEEYTEQLETIFRTLGGKRPVALIE